MSAKATTGVGNTIPCSDFRNAIVTIASASSASLTIKCQGAMGNSAPTFSSASSASNPWDYVQMIDLQDGSAINGDTGIVFSGTDDVRQFEVNTNALDYLNFSITARSAGSVTVTVVVTDNA